MKVGSIDSGEFLSNLFTGTGTVTCNRRKSMLIMTSAINVNKFDNNVVSVCHFVKLRVGLLLPVRCLEL